MKELPALNTGRSNHGCAAYYTNTNQPVIFRLENFLLYLNAMLFMNKKVLLVAGGMAGYNTILDTTEVLSSLTARKWTLKAPLPYKMHSMSGATIDNEIFMTGIVLRELKCCSDSSKLKIRRVRPLLLQGLEDL